MRNRPIRILYVGHAANLTGASRSLLDLLAGLDKDEVEPTVLLPKHGPMEAKLKELGIVYKVIPYIQDVVSFNPVKNILKQIIHPASQALVDAYVKAGNFDLVHCNSLFVIATAAKAASKAKIPYICHCRDFIAEDHKRKFLNEQKTRACMQKASCLICISHAVAKKFFPWAPGTKAVVLHDGLSTENYLIYNHALFEDKTTRVLLSGRIVPGKGQMDAIKAIEILKNRNVSVSLTIAGGIGDDAYYQECHAYIKEHNLSNEIDMIGFVDNLTNLHKKSDIELMCSSSEAMGRVTIEGMLAGSLVIGANAGATPELIQDGINGYLYEANNAESLASCIQCAITRKKSSREMAQKAQTWAEQNFDTKVYAKKIISLYQEIDLRD